MEKRKRIGNGGFMVAISTLSAALWGIQAVRRGEGMTWIAALVWLACAVVWSFRARRGRET